MKDKRQPIVVLLGMHRSGTSLTMSVLNSLGVECGKQLIPAGRGNEAGFWEHQGIVTAHERLLAELDRVWHGPKGSYPMPDGWLESGAAKRARRKLVTIVKSEARAANGGLWGFKDPRTCRLLPLWEQVFLEAQVDPKYFLAVRNPAAVVASLQKQNGMERARSELTWLQYNFEPLQHCGDKLPLVMDYDRLIERTDDEVARLASALNSFVDISPTEKKNAVARVSSDMRRSATTDSAENPIIGLAYEGLTAMGCDRSPSESFSWLLMNFLDLQRLFQPWQRDTQHALLDWAARMIVRRKYR